jgi:hypothetical protein
MQLQPTGNLSVIYVERCRKEASSASSQRKKVREGGNQDREVATAYCDDKRVGHSMFFPDFPNGAGLGRS